MQVYEPHSQPQPPPSDAGYVVIRPVSKGAPPVLHHPTCSMLRRNTTPGSMSRREYVLLTPDPPFVLCTWCHGATFVPRSRLRLAGEYHIVDGHREPVACPACGS